MKNVVTLAALFACFLISFTGCSKKDAARSNFSDLLSVANLSDSLMVTPFGVLPKSKVHKIDQGYSLSYSDNRLQMVDAKTRKLSKDFGVQTPVKVDASISAAFSKKTGSAENVQRAVTSPGLGSGWITYAQNATTVPVRFFGTNFIVPNNPTTYHNQLLYLFEGLQDGITATSHIFQPVLQFGSNGRFGGNYWTIASWYASCQGCDA
ncbi:hypothetical protein GA0116948_11738 [Chitinophaga costaii]|uniref:Uncharacterized protein n=1 Tax=Chitinophaga costaii TaxID=1335309 RepID=A0A1C4FVJ3_9BACT|nr:hypothetical protein [Chitinophaga costaii]PUZ27227.1 hypothetical protein DCM91_08415 [Chitinophaga costaii]SCC59625.1 hypothetical protein GA0116948_11738 [Chitinophaga costaii]